LYFLFPTAVIFVLPFGCKAEGGGATG